jgi:hypothetical protein
MAESNQLSMKDLLTLGNFPNSLVKPNRKRSLGPIPTKIQDNSTSPSMILKKTPTIMKIQEEPRKQPPSEFAKSASSVTDLSSNSKNNNL